MMKKWLLIVGILIFTANYAGDMPLPIGLPGCTSCPIGLTNCGNTCWMNAGLQCLFNMDDFNQEVIKGNYSPGSLGEVYIALYKMYTQAHQALTQATLQPFVEKINAIMGFANTVQQDSQEGISKLLDSLLQHNKEAAKKVTIHISQKIRDPRCKIKSESPFEYTYLSLNTNKGQEDASLMTLLKDYFGDDPIEFGKPIATQHYKKLVITELPEYLIISIAIFGVDYTFDEPQSFKIYWKGMVPETLDMMPFVNKITSPTQYDLIGVVQHLGYLQGKESGGHYIANINKAGQWYLCNDDIVSPESTLAFSGTPYVLFYRRKEVQAMPSEPTSFEQFDDLGNICAYNELVEFAESLQELAKKN